MLGLRRTRWHYPALIVLGTAGCITGRRPPTCDATTTEAHSALAWGPARLGTSTEPQGRVVDARTGLPLRDALITIEPGHRSLMSDSLGEFRIPKLAGGVYHIRIRQIGYAQVRDSVQYGMGGLRLFAALAPERGIVDYACTIPSR